MFHSHTTPTIMPFIILMTTIVGRCLGFAPPPSLPPVPHYHRRIDPRTVARSTRTNPFDPWPIQTPPPPTLLHSGPSPPPSDPHPSLTLSTVEEADLLFSAIDTDGSDTIDLHELTTHLTTPSPTTTTTDGTNTPTPSLVSTLFFQMNPVRGSVSRSSFRDYVLRPLVAPTPTGIMTEDGADAVFDRVDADGSGSVDLAELTSYLRGKGYEEGEIGDLFVGIQNCATEEDGDGEEGGTVSRTAFRRALLTLPVTEGYFLDSVHQTLRPLGVLGRLSQMVETRGLFKKAYLWIGDLCGVDREKIAGMGVSFALSYSILSHVNGAVSFSVAWFISCKRTGLSPLVPGQWKSLFEAYCLIYTFIQLVRPFRVAAAIGMSKLSAEYLEMTQRKLGCSRGVAIGVQYMAGWVVMGSLSCLGVALSTAVTGVPIWGTVGK